MSRRRYSSSRSGYPRYVSVAERHAKAQREARKLRKRGHELAPVVIEGRTIAKTFWGKAWCRNLEGYSDYANRLPRGRSYARNGSILDLRIEPGVIEALVSGTRLYKVELRIAPLEPARWAAIRAACAGQIGSLVELLSGELSSGVMEVVSRKGQGLFPSPPEIDLRCSCPDWATMCKHVAATLYGVGARLDQEPGLLFTLRGIDPSELLEEAIAQTTAPTTPTSAPTLEDDDLSSIFGIDLALEGEPVVAGAPSTPVPTTTRKRKPRAVKAASKKPAKNKKDPVEATEPEALPPKAQRLLEIIRAEPGLRSPALCRQLDASGSTVAKYVKLLRDRGLVRFVGPRSSGGYYAHGD